MLHAPWIEGARALWSAVLNRYLEEFPSLWYLSDHSSWVPHSYWWILFSITSLFHRIVAEESKANGKWNGMDPVTKRICGKVGTNHLFPKFLPQPFDFHPSCMDFGIWRHERKPPSLPPRLASHTITVVMLDEGQVVCKGIHCCALLYSYHNISPARVVFSLEFNVNPVIHSKRSSFKRMMVERHLDLLFLIFRTNF